MAASQEFAGKSVLVTGAGKGIGRAIAVMLAARGAKVVALSRSAEDLKQLDADIGSTSITVNMADAEATLGVGGRPAADATTTDQGHEGERDEDELLLHRMARAYLNRARASPSRC